MKKLLIATKEPGKVREIKKLLVGLPLKILSLKDIKLPKNFSIIEDGHTFAQNAIKKAKAYGNFSQLLTLADDSGLCVDALSGQPGIKSARYCQGSPQARIKKLLSALAPVPFQKRTAQFVCVLALYNPKTGKVKIKRGECCGLIIKTLKGKRGFGYDPVFYLPNLKKTFSQISIKEKNRLSHRAKAIKKIRRYLM
jgi:XTP/dITP diphosphohydrolase